MELFNLIYEKKIRLNVFLSFGKDKIFKNKISKSLKEICAQKDISLNKIILEKLVTPGAIIPNKLESAASEADLAVVILSADEFIQLVKSKVKRNTSRTNVWIELGWFWGRLGLQRTILIYKQSELDRMDHPSNLGGVEFMSYITESDFRKRFLKVINSLRNSKSSLAEIRLISSDPNERAKDFHEIRQLAVEKLTVVGLSLGRTQSEIPTIFNRVKAKKNLHLEFIVANPKFLLKHYQFFEEMHGENTSRSNIEFIETFFDNYESLPLKTKERISLFLYDTHQYFAAVVADGHIIGGSMIYQPFLNKAREHSFAYPRFKLKNISSNSTFQLIYERIISLRKASKKLT